MDTVRWTGVGSCQNCGWVNGTANTSSLLFWKLPGHRFEKVELGVYAYRGLRWLCSWPWAVPMTAWKQEMLQSGFPLFSSVRAHGCLLPDLLLRGALWDTGVSHLSQRFLGSHDGTPHPYERPLWCVGPKDYAETFSVRAEVKLGKETRDGDGYADAPDYLRQTQSFRNGLAQVHPSLWHTNPVS